MKNHADTIARMRSAYKEAHARFTTRLREASDADVHRVPEGGGWSVAQIGWHVAAVDKSFAAVLTGEAPVAREIADGEEYRSWAEVVAAMPDKLEAGKRVRPPDGVKRDDVLVALAESARKFDAALAGLPEERAKAFSITHPVVGTVALGDIGEWATAHIIRHNAQAKRVLASAT